MTTPTKNFYDLVPDGCNFKDRKFEAYVDRFMQEFMPGFPLQLLENSDGEHNYEDWEMEQPTYSIEEVEVVIKSTDDEWGEWSWVEEETTGEVDEDGEPVMVRRAEVFIVLDEDGDAVEGSGHEDNEIPPGHEYAGASAFILDRDAEYAKDEALADYAESGLGFPWAWNWAYLPDDRIQTEELQQAGFTVGTYRGYRLAGIDGCGYSFTGAHFAKLCAIVHANRSQYNWTVETDDGPAFIKMGE